MVPVSRAVWTLSSVLCFRKKNHLTGCATLPHCCIYAAGDGLWRRNCATGINRLLQISPIIVTKRVQAFSGEMNLEMEFETNLSFTFPIEKTRLVGGRWKLSKKLGEGSYGKVYKATDDSGKKVAVKMESIYFPGLSLLYEQRVYSVLFDGRTSAVNIPHIHFFGSYMSNNVLVMDYLGPSLEDTMMKSRRPFKMSFVARAACQLLLALEFIHDKGILHCDLKPSNIVHDLNDPNVVYIIDFGLARQFENASSVRLLHVDNGEGYLGSHDFSPLAAHLLKTPSQRDDLESLGYVLVYIFKGILPWCLTTIENSHTRNTLVKRKKGTTSPLQLCEGLPGEFVLYFQYVRQLQLGEKPDYLFLRSLFETVLWEADMCETTPWYKAESFFNFSEALGTHSTK